MTLVEKLRSLSATDFAALGVNDVAFVKAVLVEGRPVYAIHAADGTPMALVANRDVAFAAIRQQDLEPADVQ